MGERLPRSSRRTEKQLKSPRHTEDSGAPRQEQFDRNTMARSYGEGYGVPRNQGEGDDSYRIRLSGILRARGAIAEAHEVYSGRRWNDPEQGPFGPKSGIVGAIAQAMQGELSPRTLDPQTKLDDDVIAGAYITHVAGQDPVEKMVEGVMTTLGPKAGLDFIVRVIGPKDK